MVLLFNKPNMKNLIFNKLRKKLIIAIIKDFILMEMGAWSNEKKSGIIEIPNEKLYDPKKIIGIVGTEITNYSKSYKKYQIDKNSKNIHNALIELRADKYIIDDAFPCDMISISKRGMAHYMEGRSFESNYRKDRRERFAIIIAILSFTFSIVSIIISVYIK